MEFVTIEWCSPLYQESLELRHAILRAPLGRSFSSEDLDAEHNDWHFGVQVDETLVAVVVARRATKTTAKLRQMAVLPDHQRGGLGSFLLRSVEADLIARGLKAAELHARAEATGFYEKLGYQIVGEPFEEIGIQHHKMRKSLA